jgi:O-antigen/teichoic acid export membrane protein
VTLPDPGAEAGIDEQSRLSAERSRLQTDAVGGSFWITVQTLLGLPLAIVANAVIAHALGARFYGTLAIYTAIYSLVLGLLNAGISDASVQWIATHNARKESREVAEAIRRCSGYHIFIEAPLVAVLAAVLLRHTGTEAMLIGAVSSAAVMIIGTSTVVMSGAGLNALAARIGLAVTLATQTAVILVASVSPLPTSVFLGRIALGLLGPLIALLVIPSDFRRAVLRPRLPRHWPPGFLGFAFRTCGSGLVSTLVFGRSELFVFQIYDRPEQAGLFALSAGVAGLITAPIDSLLGPLLPATTGLLALSPERAGSALLRGLRTSATLAGLVAAVAVPVLAPLLPLIYGNSFTDAVVAFVILAIVSCAQSVNHPVLAFLMAGRQTGLLLKTGLLSVIADMTIAFVTIPFWGVAGAVVASCVAQLSVLAIVAHRVGAMVGVTVGAQLRAVSFFSTALAVAAIALAAELAPSPSAVRSLVGLGVSLTAVAVFGRLRPSVGLSASDVEVISGGLPRPLRASFRGTLRVLALSDRGRSA